MPPLISDPTFYAIALPAVLALGLAKGGFAGLGALSTPLIALMLPPLEGAALLLPLLLVQDVISIWVYRREWDGKNLAVLLPGAVIGLGIGWLFAAYVSDAAIRIVVGGIGIAFVLNNVLRPIALSPSQISVPKGIFWGGVSGFTSFVMQAGGPPFQIYILPQQLSKLKFVGTSTIFFAAVNALKVGPYFWLGQFSTVNLATSAVLLPLAVAANFLGIWLVRITPTAVFYKVSYALLFIISVMLVGQGVTSLIMR